MKIDSGASGNTLPPRTFQQIYGTSAKVLVILRPIPHMKLEIPGPVVVGLPISKNSTGLVILVGPQ